MAQFTVYRSSDGGAAVLNGNAGSLITVFDSILVTGQGWTHPVATSGNIASYKQPAGAGLSFVLNDNGPNGTSTTKEAWATGWESVAGVGAPVGTGSGQFPTAAQLLTTGHVVIRKSSATGAGVIQWIAFADTSTFYFFALTGDVASTYFGFAFGDFYSLKSTTDSYRCMIMGRSAENDVTAAAEGIERLTVLGTGAAGNFIARTVAGTGASVLMSKHGDVTKGSATVLVGTVQYTNGPDAETYISPVWVCESALSNIRGRLRGFYQMLHAQANFTDGQTFTGTGAYAGKTFIAIKASLGAGVFLIETSNTLETN